MPKIGEDAVKNAIRRGSEEMHAVVTGQPIQEASHQEQEAPKPSYDQALAESARTPSQGRDHAMER